MRSGNGIMAATAGLLAMLACSVSPVWATDWWGITVVDDEGWTTVKCTSLAVLPSGDPAIAYIHNPGDY